MKVNVYGRFADRGVLIWKWKKQVLGAWVESGRDFVSCDTCIDSALADARGQKVQLETDRCSLYRYALEGRAHQYGSCVCGDEDVQETLLDVIAQIEERHNVIVLREGRPFFAHYREDYRSISPLSPELRQASGEWSVLPGHFAYVPNRR